MVNQFYLNQKVRLKSDDQLVNGEVLDYNFKLDQYLVALEHGGHKMVAADKLQPNYTRKKTTSYEHV